MQRTVTARCWPKATDDTQAGHMIGFSLSRGKKTKRKCNPAGSSHIKPEVKGHCGAKVAAGGRQRRIKHLVLKRIPPGRTSSTHLLTSPPPPPLPTPPTAAYCCRELISNGFEPSLPVERSRLGRNKLTHFKCTKARIWFKEGPAHTRRQLV